MVYDELKQFGPEAALGLNALTVLILGTFSLSSRLLQPDRLH
jgi:hypothetical protein